MAVAELLQIGGSCPASNDAARAHYDSIADQSMISSNDVVCGNLYVLLGPAENSIGSLASAEALSKAVPAIKELVDDIPRGVDGTFLYALEFPNDNPDAMLYLIKLIHASYALIKIPKAPGSLHDLVNVLTVADRYDCVTFLKGFFVQAFEKYRASHWQFYSPTWLKVAWVLGMRDLFERQVVKVVDNLGSESKAMGRSGLTDRMDGKILGDYNLPMKLKGGNLKCYSGFALTGKEFICRRRHERMIQLIEQVLKFQCVLQRQDTAIFGNYFSGAELESFAFHLKMCVKRLGLLQPCANSDIMVVNAGAVHLPICEVLAEFDRFTGLNCQCSFCPRGPNKCERHIYMQTLWKRCRVLPGEIDVPLNILEHLASQAAKYEMWQYADLYPDLF